LNAFSWKTMQPTAGIAFGLYLLILFLRGRI